MNAAEDSSLLLSQRLRSLRKQGWAGKRITQERLAEAMDVSVPLISSWERPTNPAIPPQQRLDAYATFFATERSVERLPFRLIAQSQLTDDETARRDALLRELSDLRKQALGEDSAAADTPYGYNLWHFTPDQDITIVCSELPKRLLEQFPNTNPEDPDYVSLYRYSDLDALLELFGHLRAVNPESNVRIRGASVLTSDDYTSHLVLLGGVDWNAITAVMLRRAELPVRQLARVEDSDAGGFEVTENGERKMFEPKLRGEVLEEDVAHFYRSPSPFNQERTVTICNGMFAPGTYGAVRTLTDFRLRDRNHDYVRDRFAGQDTFSIISRVLVLRGEVVTPDWSDPETRLHEWPVESP